MKNKMQQNNSQKTQRFPAFQSELFRRRRKEKKKKRKRRRRKEKKKKKKNNLEAVERSQSLREPLPPV
jgi:hypothetical protein